MTQTKYYTAIFENGECLAKRLVEQNEPLVLDKSTGEVLIDEAQYNAAGALVLLDGVVLVRPSAVHDYKSGKWTLNKSRAAEIEAQVIKDAVPKFVTMAQAQLALLKFELLDNVEAAMLTDAVPREAKIYWTKSVVVRREDSTVAMMAAMLGLTDAQVDELFTLAATL